jgi:hypothetical protein
MIARADTSEPTMDTTLDIEKSGAKFIAFGIPVHKRDGGGVAVYYFDTADAAKTVKGKHLDFVQRNPGWKTKGNNYTRRWDYSVVEWEPHRLGAGTVERTLDISTALEHARATVAALERIKDGRGSGFAR